MKNTYCILAEQGLHLHNSGRCNSCSDSLHWWSDKNIPMDLTTHSLEEIWNSDSRQQFLNDLRNGVEHANCEKCWQKERIGIESKRQISNRIFSNNNKLTPQFIDLKWGNVCNLKCRHCNPWTSSKWLKEWYAVERKDRQEFAEYAQEFSTTQKSYRHDNHEHFHTTFKKWFLDSKNLMLYGGEGMYVKDVQKMFAEAANSGQSKNIDVYINTNGTIYSEEWIEILSKFRSVRMAFSIDGIGKSFDYIRSGASWNEVCTNFKKYQQISNIDISIVTTIFTLNVYNSAEILYNIFNELGVMPSVNFVYGPEWWDIRILPIDVKEKISIKLDELKFTDAHYCEQINQIKKFLFDSVENADNKYEQMKHWIKSIDSLRNESFAEVFTEFNKLIKV